MVFIMPRITVTRTGAFEELGDAAEREGMSPKEFAEPYGAQLKKMIGEGKEPPEAIGSPLPSGPDVPPMLGGVALRPEVES